MTDKKSLSKKVNLVVKESRQWDRSGFATKSLTQALPFFKSRRGEYFHRVRSGNTHWRHGGLSHMSVSFWCGNGGFIGEKGRLYSEIPEGGILCATCEGRAIGSGQDGAKTINGREVRYSPRKKESEEDNG